MKAILVLSGLAALSACAAPPAPEEPPKQGPVVTPEIVKPLTEAYRDFVASLLALDSKLPLERADAMKKLQVSQYGYFPDDRDLIAKAGDGDADARRELIRRGRMLDAMFAFWGNVDSAAWNDARQKIVALGSDAKVILVNMLFRMLLNGQLQNRWSQIRFQLIAIGDESFETAVALFKAKADATPDSIIFRKDDLVQIALVILGFGDRARPVIEQHAKSNRFNVRRAIAVALGEGKASEHFDLLEVLLRKDPDWMVRADAATAMGSMPERGKAGAVLVDTLKGEQDRNVRRYVAESLGTLVYKDAVPQLITSLDIPDYEYRERAMHALFQITGQQFRTVDQWQKWYATQGRPKPR